MSLELVLFILRDEGLRTTFADAAEALALGSEP